MPTTIRLAGTRFGPDETVRASYEPDRNATGLLWRLFTPAEEIQAEMVDVVPDQRVYDFTARGLAPGLYHLQVYVGDAKNRTIAQLRRLDPEDEQVFEVSDAPVLRVALERSDADGAGALNEDPLARYDDFTAFLAAEGEPQADNPFAGGRSAFAAFSDENYEQLKQLSRRYVRGIRVTSLAQLAEPYIRDRMNDEPALPAVYQDPIMRFFPGIELIWNFWQEAGMLVQTLNLILARFQNRVIPGQYAPLDRFDVTPLATLHALLYAFVDDEQHRMTVRRRAAEYEYEYGLKLIGRAIPAASSYVERRSGFLEAFHQVLHQAHVYFKELDDLTVNADAFPLYRTLRECHLELSQGSHNQYGQLAVAARAEFLQMQFLLAQPEMRLFLGGRPMTPYPEPWMDRVDRMKEIQAGWPAASVMHFHDLATIGERLVLTIRLGSWADPAVGSGQAAAWAQAFRGAIQKYVAAYRAVTGVDLSVAPDTTQPAVLIMQRALEQRRRA